MEELLKRGVSLGIDWTPGHVDIARNEIADRLAKSAEEVAENMEDEDSWSRQYILRQQCRCRVKRNDKEHGI